MSNPSLAIDCQALRRVYSSRAILGKRRETVALDALDLQVPAGQVFGLLGPNGAGKTTTVRILSTLLTPTSGSARVLGFDVDKQASHVRRHIGLILGGDRGLYGRLTGRQNLEYFAALNHMPPREGARKVAAQLELVGLTERADSLVDQYSRGMKQRLHIARGLLTDPTVIFMDEPTTGLDPESAQQLRDLVPQLAGQGKSILLTIHYMFEADTLCHTIAIINRGKLVALGTPADIKRRFARVTVTEVTVRQIPSGLQKSLAELPGVVRVDKSADGPLQKFTLQSNPASKLTEKIAAAAGQGNIEQLNTREPTLEEAYLSILR